MMIFAICGVCELFVALASRMASSHKREEGGDWGTTATFGPPLFSLRFLLVGWSVGWFVGSLVGWFDPSNHETDR